MVEWLPSKEQTTVRFRSPAPISLPKSRLSQKAQHENIRTVKTTRDLVVYLVARTPRKLELISLIPKLKNLGYIVNSRWLEENHGRSIKEWSSDVTRWKIFARDDFEDISAAKMVICFTEERLSPEAAKSHGARHVELGIALGLGKKV